MNTVKLLHNAAMDLFELGKIHKAKGNPDVYLENLPQAYALSKEAARMAQEDENDTFWKHSFARSAGWIAFHYEKYHEALFWAETGLNGCKEGYEIQKLKELKAAAKEKIAQLPKTAEMEGKMQFAGILTHAFFDDHKIKIRENGKRKYKVVLVPKDKMEQVNRYHLGDLVEVEARLNDKNHAVLENIRRAA